MTAKYVTYKPKKILNVHKHLDGGWYWTKYSAHPYLGCEFGCQYCYGRDKHYCPYDNIEDFDKLIKIKENAPELLKKELKNKPKELISVGEWQPVEAKYKLSRKMLEVCLDLGFPVFVLEKSPLILRDLDLLKKINKKAGVISGFSIITTKDDEVRKIFEPKALPVKARFEAMKKFAKAGIMTGTHLMPILPFFYDQDENLEAVIKMTKQYGGQYVLASSLTLWGEVKNYFYKVLAKRFPELIDKYEKLYSSQAGTPVQAGVGENEIFSEYWQPISQKVKKLCQKYKILDYIPRPVQFYDKELQLNKKIAEKFYFKARDYQDAGPKYKFREWAYRKAAWAIDDLKESLADIYKHTWLVGIERIPGIGNRLAHEIEKEIKSEHE